MAIPLLFGQKQLPFGYHYHDCGYIVREFIFGTEQLLFQWHGWQLDLSHWLNLMSYFSMTLNDESEDG